MTQTRLIAAAVGLAVLLPALSWGGVPGTALIVLAALVVCVDEYARMAFPDDPGGPRSWMTIASVALCASIAWGGSSVTLAVGAASLLGTFGGVTLWPPEPISGAADRVARQALGVAWIGGLCSFLMLLRLRADGLGWVLLPMFVAWFGDTGAYFSGRAFGKTPLHPRVSPKKSVEGFVGGLVGSVVGALVCARYGLSGVSVGHAALMGLAGGAVAVLGDLSESLIKRSFDVKDSGWIMPGHGGLLDRVDSLLFVAPTVYVYSELLSVGVRG
jgi:phosphatidate cytidylyltransferase